MESYKYIPELKRTLAQYKIIQNEIEELEKKEKLIRGQVQKWMASNKLTHFEIEDDQKQIWKITQSPQYRNKVHDYDAVIRALPDQYKGLITKNEIEVFAIRKVKDFSNEWALKSNVTTD